VHLQVQRVSPQNLITNGGFELPDDGVKHYFITERTGWFSDDIISNNNGTEYSTSMFGDYYWYNINTAGTIYNQLMKLRVIPPFI
jgi:hypothetical protein